MNGRRIQAYFSWMPMILQVRSGGDRGLKFPLFCRLCWLGVLCHPDGSSSAGKKQ